MTTYWARPSSLIAVEPGSRDLFVLTFVNGTRVAMQPVTEYERARIAAQAFAERTKLPVKLLPMTLDEVLAFSGTSRESVVAHARQPGAPDDRQLIIDTCTDVLRTCDDAAARGEAIDLLTKMGVMKP